MEVEEEEAKAEWRIQGSRRFPKFGSIETAGSGSNRALAYVIHILLARQLSYGQSTRHSFSTIGKHRDRQDRWP